MSLVACRVVAFGKADPFLDSVLIWDETGQNLLCRVARTDAGITAMIAFSDCQTYLATTSNSRVQIWDISYLSTKDENVLTISSPFMTLYHPDCEKIDRIRVGCADRNLFLTRAKRSKILLWDLNLQEVVVVIDLPMRTYGDVLFSADNARIFSNVVEVDCEGERSQLKATIKVWSASDGQKVMSFPYNVNRSKYAHIALASNLLAIAVTVTIAVPDEEGPGEYEICRLEIWNVDSACQLTALQFGVAPADSKLVEAAVDTSNTANGIGSSAENWVDGSLSSLCYSGDGQRLAAAVMLNSCSDDIGPVVIIWNISIIWERIGPCFRNYKYLMSPGWCRWIIMVICA